MENFIYPFKPALQLTKFSPYIHFPDFFSKGECDKIKKLMANRETFRGKVEGTSVDSPVENKKFRDSTICGIDFNKDTSWIFDKLQGAITHCNFEIWGYDLSGFCEGIQIAKYQVGDFYGYHQDIGNGILSQRKLSVVVQLTPPSEYEGGYLEFFQNGYAPREQGSLILFPSFQHHQVTPILQGVRHSLVAWLSGNPYR